VLINLLLMPIHRHAALPAFQMVPISFPTFGLNLKRKSESTSFPSGLQLSMVSAGLHERGTMSVWLSSINMSLSSSLFD
jgi:hypothetical protein